MSNRSDKTIPELTTEELVELFKECSAVAQSLMLNMCKEELPPVLTCLPITFDMSMLRTPFPEH